MRFQFKHIPQIHIKAKFKDNLVYTSAVISKVTFEQRGFVIRTINHFGQSKTVKNLQP